MGNTSPTGIHIEDAWVEETNDRRAVLHLKIASTGAIADRLVRGSTELAERVAFFNQLGQASDDILIPADSNWVMGTDAPRIELIGLTQSLKAPGNFAVLLVFERAGKIGHNVRVEGAALSAQRVAN
jgi:copper(I)-binding protein